MNYELTFEDGYRVSRNDVCWSFLTRREFFNHKDENHGRVTNITYLPLSAAPAQLLDEGLSLPFIGECCTRRGDELHPHTKGYIIDVDWTKPADQTILSLIILRDVFSKDTSHHREARAYNFARELGYSPLESFILNSHFWIQDQGVRGTKLIRLAPFDYGHLSNMSTANLVKFLNQEITWLQQPLFEQKGYQSFPQRLVSVWSLGQKDQSCRAILDGAHPAHYADKDRELSGDAETIASEFRKFMGIILEAKNATAKAA